MMVIAILLVAIAVLAVALCAVADPVLLSRINGEPAEGASGRHVHVRPEQVALRGQVGPRERLAA
jgi:hypothetical protein